MTALTQRTSSAVIEAHSVLLPVVFSGRHVGFWCDTKLRPGVRTVGHGADGKDRTGSDPDHDVHARALQRAQLVRWQEHGERDRDEGTSNGSCDREEVEGAVPSESADYTTRWIGRGEVLMYMHTVRASPHHDACKGHSTRPQHSTATRTELALCY